MNIKSGPFYNPDGFRHAAPMAGSHFWFRGRNRLICWALARYFPRMKSFCEVGCGGGIVLRAIEREFSDVDVIGIDFLEEGLKEARLHVKRAKLRLGNILDLPFAGELDAIGAFDVLEHIPDHAAACANLYRALKSGGGLVITVPQHPFLWSFTDEAGFHKRRYERSELAHIVETAGFRILRLTSFVSLLLPVLWLSRLRVSSTEAALTELRVGRLSNAVCGAAMTLERWLIRSGVSLPMGGSLLLIAVRD